MLQEVRGSMILNGQGKIRGFFGQLFGVLTKTLVLKGVVDPQCGFKLFRGELGKKAFRNVKTNGVLFDIEFLISANKLGAKIKEVPVVWNHNSDSRIKYNLVSSFKVFKELLNIKYRLKILTPVTILQK